LKTNQFDHGKQKAVVTQTAKRAIQPVESVVWRTLKLLIARELKKKIFYRQKTIIQL
jgi:hypothetical protein